MKNDKYPVYNDPTAITLERIMEHAQTLVEVAPMTQSQKGSFGVGFQGDVGTGKTLLCQRLVAEALANGQTVAFLDPRQDTSPDRLYPGVSWGAARNGLTYIERGDVGQITDDEVHAATQADVLVIDNPHAFSGPSSLDVPFNRTVAGFMHQLLPTRAKRGALSVLTSNTKDATPHPISGKQEFAPGRSAQFFMKVFDLDPPVTSAGLQWSGRFLA